MAQSMSLEKLTAYLAACATWEPQQVVVGHPAPDTDTVVSSLIEAWRRWLCQGLRATPVVQATALPREIAFLLEPVGAQVLTAAHDRGAALLSETTLPLVLTDHHDSYAPRPIAAIIDHHLPPDNARFSGIDTDIRPVGAVTSLVALHCREAGLTPDASVARMLLGAILLDTEGLSPAKTKAEDTLAAEWLIALSKEDANALFTQLRAQLLAETDLPTLYRRDMRLFPGLSFAVIKVWADTPLDMAALQHLLRASLSQQPTALAKIARYVPEGLREDTYIAAGAAAEKVLDTIIRVCHGRRTPEGVVVTSDGFPISRKRLVPLLLPLLNEETPPSAIGPNR